jgi:hypothetical protein
MVSDQLASGWGKAVAGAALLVAGVGTGVGVQQAAKPPSTPAEVRAQPSSGPTARSRPVTSERSAAAPKRDTTSRETTDRRGERSGRRDQPRRGKGTEQPSAAGRATSAGGGPAPQPAAARRESASTKPDAAKTADKLPAVTTPSAVPGDPVKATGEALDTTVENTGSAVNTVVQDATRAVDEAVEGTGPVGDVVHETTETVNEVVGDTTEGLNQTTDNVTGILGGDG